MNPMLLPKSSVSLQVDRFILGVRYSRTYCSLVVFYMPVHLSENIG